MKNNCLPTSKFRFVLLFALLFSFRGNAQYVTIPDPVFASFLNTQYPSCMNGNQLDTTSTGAISFMSITNLSITDLYGIQYFASMYQLNISNTDIVAIPAFPPSLTNLYISESPLTVIPPLPPGIEYVALQYTGINTLPELPEGLLSFICMVNEVTTIPELPSTLTEFWCSDNQISSLPELPDSLEMLLCDNNLLTILPDLPSTLTQLNCDYNQLTLLPVLPEGLQTLSATHNQLTAAPNTPSSAQTMLLYNNNIHCLDTLPELNATLQIYEIDYNPYSCVPNHTSYLNNLPLCHENDEIGNPNNCPAAIAPQYITIPDPGFVSYLNANFPWCMYGDQLDITNNIDLITFIHIDSTPIATLEGVQYFTSLNELICTNAGLVTIPELPPLLQMLWVNDNNLDTLPALPNTLTSLLCQNNQLLTLPALPESLYTLWAAQNLLTALPDLPESLHELLCGENQLTVIPELPSALTVLICNHNQLTTLPIMPEGMTTGVFANNQLTALPPVPASAITMNFNNNQIHCFDSLPELIAPLQYFEIYGNPYTCVPNSTSYTGTTPICQEFNPSTNPYGCAPGDGIHGNVYQDVVANCLIESGEPGIYAIQLNLLDGSGNLLATTTTDTNGHYFFGYTNGIYTVKIDTVGQSYTTSCVSELSVTSSGNVDSVDFLINCGSPADLGIAGYTVTGGLVFPGQSHLLSVYAGNLMYYGDTSCLEPTAATLTITVNGPVSYQSPGGIITPAQINGNTFVYDLPDLSAIDYFGTFALYLQTDTTAQSGDSICVNAALSIPVGDPDTINNTMQFCYIVGNSYDPNYKEVYPALVPEGYDGFLTYTIHFQNTGTEPAIDIRLADQLDGQVDPSSFGLMQSSHPVVASVNGSMLTFRFDDIWLADSTSNEPQSHGFVQYRIRPNNGLPAGTTIPNTAGIYFDYNDPVITNTATTVYYDPTLSLTNMKSPLPVSYPNPAGEKISLLYGKPFEILEISIHDLNGRILQTQTFHSGEPVQLSVVDLSNGYYLLQMHSDHSAEPVVISFVKE
jgi:uncharacterized repeat protein (TIGR01451 family)